MQRVVRFVECDICKETQATMDGNESQPRIELSKVGWSFPIVDAGAEPHQLDVCPICTRKRRT